MTTPPFFEKLQAASERNRSLLCIGLDPEPSLMPMDDVPAFTSAIIEATADLACAYKCNLAFYEALGLPGLRALEVTLAHIPSHIPVIGDAKRGDVPNSAAAYARALFERYGFDAVTVNPYGGQDAVAPFLDYRDRGVFVWCRSSNPGAGDLQDLPCQFEGETMPLYEAVARQAARWDRFGNVGLVMGATYPEQLARIRGCCPDKVLLVPGIGAQQGDLASAVRAGLPAHPQPSAASPERSEGPLEGAKSLLLINASRSILYAYRQPAQPEPSAASPERSEGPLEGPPLPLREVARGDSPVSGGDSPGQGRGRSEGLPPFAQAARAAALRLREAINGARSYSSS